MKNVEMNVTKDNKLVISVDLSQEHGLSGSGKSIIIGSSEGNAKVTDKMGREVMIGVNVYRKK